MRRFSHSLARCHHQFLLVNVITSALNLLINRNQVSQSISIFLSPHNRMMSNLSRVVFFTMMIFQWFYRGAAFQSTSATVRRRFEINTALNAWSLPNPTVQSSFGSLTNTWYNEVKNPTARTTVYNEYVPHLCSATPSTT